MTTMHPLYQRMLDEVRSASYGIQEDTKWGRLALIDKEEGKEKPIERLKRIKEYKD